MWETYSGSGGGGVGDVTGPASSADNDVVIFNGTTGKIIKDTGVPIGQLARKDLPNVFADNNTFLNIYQPAGTGLNEGTPASSKNVIYHDASKNYTYIPMNGKYSVITQSGYQTLLIDEGIKAETLNLLQTGSFKILDSNGNPLAEFYDNGTIKFDKSVQIVGTLTATGLGTTPLDANQLNSGTVPDARLSTNVARRDQTNTFSQIQTYQSHAIYTTGASLYSSSTAADKKRIEINDGYILLKAASGGYIYFFTSTDATIARFDDNMSASFYGPVYAQGQTLELSGGPNALFNLYHTGGPVDKRRAQIYKYNDLLVIRNVNDAVTVEQSYIYLYNDGRVLIGGPITERGRGLPMGEWQSYTPYFGDGNGALGIGNGSSVGRYTLIGKTVHYVISISYGSTTNLGAGGSGYQFGLPLPVQLGFNIPPPAIATILAGQVAYYVGMPLYISSTTVFLVIGNTGTAYTKGNPAAAVAGDYVHLAGTYETT